MYNHAFRVHLPKQFRVAASVLSRFKITGWFYRNRDLLPFHQVGQQ